jgi:hypothetical protein
MSISPFVVILSLSKDRTTTANEELSLYSVPAPNPKSQKQKITHAHPPPHIDRRHLLPRAHTTLHLHRVRRAHRVTHCIAPSPRGRLRREPVEGGSG